MLSLLANKNKLIYNFNMNYELLKNHNFDVESAIERFAGKVELYNKYIKLFTEEVTYYQLEEAVKEKKIDLAELYVHSLKGLAGNLGVNSVYNASCIMLKEIRTGDKNKALTLFNFVKEEFLLAKKIILLADS